MRQERLLTLLALAHCLIEAPHPGLTAGLSGFPHLLIEGGSHDLRLRRTTYPSGGHAPPRGSPRPGTTAASAEGTSALQPRPYSAVVRG